MLVLIAGFHVTSQKFKLLIYRPYWDFALMMYLIEQLKTYKSGKTVLRISRKLYFSNLNLGEGLCKFTSFYFLDSELYLSNGFIYLL